MCKGVDINYFAPIEVNRFSISSRKYLAYMDQIRIMSSFTIILFSLLISGCQPPGKTNVSIDGDKWVINKSVINKSTPSEGLLMNIRMVNSVFEDRGDKMPEKFHGFDPEMNTETFISKMPEYVSAGSNAFTISLQGGAPGYEGAVNTAFESDGSMRMEYFDRVARVIKAADANSSVVILSCFYQRQHSHGSALNTVGAIKNSLSNTVKWIKENNFQNVVLEVSNEYRHGGYRNWKDGKWLVSTKGQIELIELAKLLHPALPVGTSGMGNGSMNDSIARVADYITIHFNNTALEDYADKIKAVKKYGKPVICNEDDKTGIEGANALLLSVINKCGWGYMNSRQNQTIPFRFEGTSDDTAVYNMMKKASLTGFSFDEAAITQPSLIITYPNDGDIFRIDQKINITWSYLFPDTSQTGIIHVLKNSKPLGVVEGNSRQYPVQLSDEGIWNIEFVVMDKDGEELLRSPKVDIIVRK